MYCSHNGYCCQRLCISSGGNSKPITVPRNQTQFEKLNYKFTLNPAIDYAFCYAHVPLSIVPKQHGCQSFDMWGEVARLWHWCCDSKGSNLKRCPIYPANKQFVIHFSNDQLDSTPQLLLFEFLKQESPLKQQ